MVKKCKYYKYMYTEISKYTKMKRNKPEKNKALGTSLSLSAKSSETNKRKHITRTRGCKKINILFPKIQSNNLHFFLFIQHRFLAQTYYCFDIFATHKRPKE